jgi:ATPase subunit of ABC transporter with duplicated ATPase domains
VGRSGQLYAKFFLKKSSLSFTAVRKLAFHLMAIFQEKFMFHSPIQIKKLSLCFPGVVCFENFTATIEFGSRIAVIGRNGSGKSTLLKILCGAFEPTAGAVEFPSNVLCGYVQQLVEGLDSLSGGQRFQRAMTDALCQNPNLLLLDEPTNHLDMGNRRSLLRMLRSYGGTLIVVSHDVELLRSCIGRLWHIDGGKIEAFAGAYGDYAANVELRRMAIGKELGQLDRQKKEMHSALVREQRRAAKSRAIGKKKIERRAWIPAVAHGKANGAEKATGKMVAIIAEKKQNLLKKLSTMPIPEVIDPQFAMAPGKLQSSLIVTSGSVGYGSDPALLTDINISLAAGDRMAIIGANGSGKSTLVKAILDDESIVKSGNWSTPPRDCIGYLDQHYGTLNAMNSPLDVISQSTPDWSMERVRNHLAAFLFRKNEEVHRPLGRLSGGERARLSLAQIAAKPPKLLILDEITNNLDIETCARIVQILKNFPGTMVAISHDANFLASIGIINCYLLEGRRGRWKSAEIHADLANF